MVSLLASLTVELIRPKRQPLNPAVSNAIAPQKTVLPVIVIPAAVKIRHAASTAAALKRPLLPPQKKAALKAAAAAANLNVNTLHNSKLFTRYAC